MKLTDKEEVNEAKSMFLKALGDICFKKVCINNGLNYPNMYHAMFKSKIFDLKTANLILEKARTGKQIKNTIQLVEV